MVIIWFAFIALILAFLALDLGVFNKETHVIGFKESMIWTVIWITISLLFSIVIYFIYEHHFLGMGESGATVMSGQQATLQYLTGYIIEKTLSLDNIFVIALIFTYFKIPGLYQHRILYWGILGALIMRGLMIWGGALLIEKFSFTIYLFGGLLLFTAFKLLVSKEEDKDFNQNVVVKIAKKMFPLTDRVDSDRFFIREKGVLTATPLFLVLLVVESTDVLFAVDSIPAIFAVTRDPFIVFTSNVFAILGLRALYFALAGMMEKFKYLKVTLVFILAFVGIKMIISHHYHLPTWVSLLVILGFLVIGVLASVFNREDD